ncbi:cuticle protein 10.6-like [Dermacentor silvarum]|uniref:cuticle protein 10.6-like n=1 Tax=Dermacentor silvarum TaxID=543639 RepID=UPI0021006A04|nr:cuticle protein 10.6-like [Dermacentor silvarum]
MYYSICLTEYATSRDPPGGASWYSRCSPRIRACIVLTLATSAFAGYVGTAGYGLGYHAAPVATIAHAPVATAVAVPAVATVAHAVPAVATYHAAPAVATVAHAVPAVAAYHATPAYYGYGVGTLGYGVGHYGFGHGLLGYGLNYGYGLGTPFHYGALLRKKCE